MKRSVILTFRDDKANTASTIEIKEDSEKKAMFDVLLAKGVYSLTSKHVYEISADQAIAVPGNGEAIYIGDISLWHSDVSGVDWLKGDYKEESIAHFISQYPQFANNVVQVNALCGDMPPPDSKLIGKWTGIEEDNNAESISFGTDGEITMERVGFPRRFHSPGRASTAVDVFST